MRDSIWQNHNLQQGLCLPQPCQSAASPSQHYSVELREGDHPTQLPCRRGAVLCWDPLLLVCGAGTVLSLLLQGRVWTAQQAGCHQSGLGAWFELLGSSRQARLSCKYPLRGQSCGDSACPQGRLRWGAPLSLAHGSLSQARWQLADLSYSSCSCTWACRTVPAARRSDDQLAATLSE